MNDELDELIAKACDGRADDTDRARLTGLLRRDPDARDEYLRQVDLHAALADEAMPLAESNIINYTPRELTETSRPFAWHDVLKLAAAIAVLLGIGAVMFRQSPPEIPIAASAVSTRPIATLLFAENCRWAESQLAEGTRLASGRIELLTGTAVVRWDGGAEAVLTGPVELELESAGSARLHHGEVVVRATDGAEGFTLHTPASEVVDLGTEFAVKVESTGATEVHVLDGEVACRDEGASNQGDVLVAGKAVRFERAESSPKTVELNAPRFAEVIRRIKPKERPDLMTVYEGFPYDAGSYAPAEILKGKGWAGPWRLRSQSEMQTRRELDSATDMRIVHGKLSVAWPVRGGRLGMLEMPAGKSFRVRPMAKPIDMTADAITYFSLMTHEPDHLAKKTRKLPNEGVRLTFRSSVDYWGEALSFGMSQSLRPRIRTGTGYGVISSLSIPDEQSLLWVGKIVSRAEGEDEVSFRIYGQQDSLDYAEPGEWHVVTRGLQHDAKLNLVLVTSQGASPRVVDELRIGPTWRSVVPISEVQRAAE